MEKTLNKLSPMIVATYQKNITLLFIVFYLVFPGGAEKCFAQTELQAWGNITGIRVQG
jgi:hypothetical protein